MKKNKEEKPIKLEVEEVSLIFRALKNQIKYIEEEKFYRRTHPVEIYDIELKRCWEIIEKLTMKVPEVKFIKMPKFY